MKKLKPIPKSTVNTTQILTVMQVAEELQISRSKAYELVRGNNFPKIRIGKRLLIPREALQKWIEDNTTLCVLGIDEI